MKRSGLKFWLFLLPALVSFSIVVLVPMFIGFGFSLTNRNGINNSVSFVGFKNFTRMFLADSNFVHSLFFTFGVVFFTIILVNLFGLLLALLVTQKFRGSNFLRSVFFMPNLIGGLLLGFTWKFIFIDIFSAVGKALGFGFLQGWLSNMHTGFFGIIILNVWQMSGYMMIIYIAQLQQIPNSVLEAAKIDGAGCLQLFRSVIFPLLMPAFTVGVFFSIVNSFKMFDQNLALTNGDPYRSTEMLALNIYNTAFSNHEFGYAQAKAVVFLLIVAVLGVGQLLLTKKKEVEM